MGFFSIMGTSVCVPQATSLLKVCHRAKCLSQNCTDVGCVGWPETLALKLRPARMCCYVQYCPDAPVPIVEWNCGVLGSSSPRSVYVFQPSVVLSEGWPPLLYEFIVICCAKIRSIHVSVSDPLYPKICSLCCLSVCLQLCSWCWRLHHPVGSEWWQAWLLTRERSGGLTCRNVLLPFCKELIKVAMAYSSKRWSWMCMFCTALACHSLSGPWAFLNTFQSFCVGRKNAYCTRSFLTFLAIL